MEQIIKPPWDSPGILILDAPALLSNIDRVDIADSLIDLRSPIMTAIAPRFFAEFLRRGISGFITGSQFPRWTESISGFPGYLAPPYDSSVLREAIRNSLIPAIGHIGEAILASNEAQALKRHQKILLRVRGGNLDLDSGPTGFLPLVERIHSLPMLEVVGIYLDEPFKTRLQCDQLSRAVSRHLPEVRSMLILGAETGPLPLRFKHQKTISDHILGLVQHEPPMISTVSIKLWGYPLSETEKGFLVTADAGWRDGLFLKARPTVRVSGETGKIIDISERRIVMEIPKRPAFPSPYIVTLLGNDFDYIIGLQEWGEKNLSQMVEALKERLPSYMRIENSIEMESF
ncbi:MAG: hypothetical protein HQM10_00730 [Candidatus Riflebacteria bacterium]|nr:hypothetical protein [Candidatus Riflebacteria bacterium]